jgi:ATP-dependent Clp protease ATP-binding subunit ClpA
MAAVSQNVEWDESTQRLCRMACEESIALGDEYIGTQHLLLAAVTVTPFAAHGIARLRPDSVRAAIIAAIGTRDAKTVLLSPGGQTPRAKLVLQRAAERASRQSRAVACKDIWFGLLADPESPCVAALWHLGIEPAALARKFV